MTRYDKAVRLSHNWKTTQRCFPRPRSLVRDVDQFHVVQTHHHKVDLSALINCVTRMVRDRKEIFEHVLIKHPRSWDSLSCRTYPGHQCSNLSSDLGMHPATHVGRLDDV